MIFADVNCIGRVARGLFDVEIREESVGLARQTILGPGSGPQNGVEISQISYGTFRVLMINSDFLDYFKCNSFELTEIRFSHKAKNTAMATFQNPEIFFQKFKNENQRDRRFEMKFRRDEKTRH